MWLITRFQLTFIWRVIDLKLIGNRHLSFTGWGWVDDFHFWVTSPYKHLWGSKSQLYLDTPADAYLWRAAAVFLGELHDWWMRESLTFGQRTVPFKNNILLPAIFNQLQWLLEGMKLHLQVNQTVTSFSFIYTHVLCNHIHFDQQQKILLHL